MELEKKMKNCLIKVYCANQEQVIRNYGEKVWEWLCDYVYTGHYFTAKTIWENCPVFEGFAKRTRQLYTAAILNNIFAEFINDSERCPIIKINKSRYQMKDVE